MRLVNKVIDKAIDILVYISGVLVIYQMLIITIEILSRKIANVSLFWASESCDHAIYIITFFSAAWLLKNKSHIKTDVVLEMVNPRSRLIMETINSIICGALCLFIAYRAAIVSIDMWQRNIFTLSQLEIPTAPLIAVMALGSLLLCIQFGRNVYADFKELRTGPVKAEE